jgi:hypothetical protein
MDEDLGVLRDLLVRRGIDWPQICDGKGRKSELTKLFNAWAFPRHFVLDREGRIAATHSGAKGVPEVARVLEKLLRN